jgi:hypothetical protein
VSSGIVEKKYLRTYMLIEDQRNTELCGRIHKFAGNNAIFLEEIVRILRQKRIKNLHNKNNKLPATTMRRL